MSERAILAVFHMPGCPHCVEVTGPRGSCAGLKNVDVLEIENSHRLTKGLPIDGFPTLWLVTPFEVREYAGRSRSQTDLQAWIDRARARTHFSLAFESV